MPREISLEAIQLGITQTVSKHNCFPEIIVIENSLWICNNYHKTNLWFLTPRHAHHPIFKSKSATLAKTMWSCLIDCNYSPYKWSIYGKSNEVSMESLSSQEKGRSIVYIPHTHTTYHYLPHPLLGDFFFCPQLSHNLGLISSSLWIKLYLIVVHI